MTFISRSRSIPRLLLPLVVVSFATPLRALSQVYSGTGNRQEVFVGTETELYLRYLSLTDTAAGGNTASWTLRPLSPAEVGKLAHLVRNSPWGGRLSGFADSTSRAEFRVLSSSASVRFNSEYPYGANDAAIWAGRGLTFAGQAGGFARIGPLSLTLVPLVFWAQNRNFQLGTSNLPCGCGDPINGSSVDLPQRYGATGYGRLDPGQSSIRLDAFGISAGLSTANEGWGPSNEFPYLLGNNAPGFAHLFLGSSRPFPVFIGRAHLRVIYGRLDQSQYSPVTGSKFYFSSVEAGRVRFGSGLVASFQPRGLDGLEIGGARFTHSVWPRAGIPPSYFRKPFEAFLKSHLAKDFEQQLGSTDNELATAFARWAFKGSGLEVYGEYGRDDHSYDLRDLVQEPDHQRVYSLGLAKVFGGGGQSTQFGVLRLELMNFELPPLATTGRGEGGIYTHSHLQQGHTNRGQLLGANVGVGAAAASTIRWDRYSGTGRWGVFWHRNVRQETADPTLTHTSAPQSSDVIEALGIERLRFTRHFDVTTSVTAMREFDRNFDHSLSNINAAISITLPR
jgi:hypothetical protein